MRKLTLALAVAVSLSTTACANPNWVGPALIGGVVGYAVAQPRPVYYPQPTYYGNGVYSRGYMYGCRPVYQLVSVIEPNGSTSTRQVYAGCQ
ncbi:hypothetical protein UFOVP71_233 [uncultured Caudovirales phage]|uniref:Lipoprotein n=1 Tax=uncultured Caudovirales phage TaxID=2100421 RepID=A0A6J5T9T4_9CAUD|nr:hypothetical protein UFOVP71_233 [uncultured Caudovirales phage]